MAKTFMFCSRSEATTLWLVSYINSCIFRQSTICIFHWHAEIQVMYLGMMQGINYLTWGPRFENVDVITFKFTTLEDRKDFWKELYASDFISPETASFLQKVQNCGAVRGSLETSKYKITRYWKFAYCFYFLPPCLLYFLLYWNVCKFALALGTHTCAIIFLTF